MAKARPIPGLAPDTRFGDAASAAVRVRAAEVFGFVDRALDVTDIEGVHDMRVATRRLRAALEVFGPCFASAEHKQLLGEVKRLADVLGQRRDPDVAIEALESFEKGLALPDRPGVGGLIAELRGQQADANETVAEELARVRENGLAERLRLLADATGDETPL